MKRKDLLHGLLAIGQCSQEEDIRTLIFLLPPGLSKSEVGDHLTPGVQDQCGQRSETTSQKKKKRQKRK